MELRLAKRGLRPSLNSMASMFQVSSANTGAEPIGGALITINFLAPMLYKAVIPTQDVIRLGTLNSLSSDI